MARKPSKTKALPPLPPLRIEPSAWPANEIELWATARLVPYANNARTHSDRQVREIAGLIAKFGWTSPILVDETGMLLAGHGRVLAAKLLGLKEVPVMTARGWSEADKRAYIIADNKVAENAGWDQDLLALELDALANMPEFDGTLADLGFTDRELAKLLPEGGREGHEDPDADAPAAPLEPVSQPGDVWLLGEHRLMCGDSTNADHVAALLVTDKPHLMVTDPPYGVDYDPDWRNGVLDTETGEIKRKVRSGGRAIGEVANDHSASWRAAWALFPGDVFYVWHAGLHGSTVEADLRAEGFEPHAQIIWAKNHLVISRGHYHWKHEPCWYGWRNGAAGNWCGDRSQTTLWEIEHRKSETGHGTQKPIECMARPMRNNSKAGDLVYEPFSGSGTTIIAGEQLGRRVRAMELMPAYVDIAVKRWEGFTQKTAILAAGEKERAAVAAERGIKLAA